MLWIGQVQVLHDLHKLVLGFWQTWIKLFLLPNSCHCLTCQQKQQKWNMDMNFQVTGIRHRNGNHNSNFGFYEANKIRSACKTPSPRRDHPGSGHKVVNVDVCLNQGVYIPNMNNVFCTDNILCIRLKYVDRPDIIYSVFWSWGIKQVLKYYYITIFCFQYSLYLVYIIS